MEYRIIRRWHDEFVVQTCEGRHLPWEDDEVYSTFESAANSLNTRGLDLILATGE